MEYKICPNCGSAEFTVEGIADDSSVFCDECGEERTLEEWQADTARERILRAENAALKEQIAAKDALVEALENLDKCTYRTTWIANAAVGGDCNHHSLLPEKIEYEACRLAVENARARVAELEGTKNA